MDVEEKKEDKKEEESTEPPSSAPKVVQGVRFVPPDRSSRSSKVFEFFWISESKDNALCLCCNKILKGVNTTNCCSHLSMHNSPFFPLVQEFLRDVSGKHKEKEEADEWYITALIFLCYDVSSFRLVWVSVLQGEY
jgi:hypothetical protein